MSSDNASCCLQHYSSNDLFMNEQILLTEFILLVGTVLVNNFVLVKFLGLCPFMGVSGKLETAIGMSMATTFVLTIASITSYLVETYVLTPLGINYLRTLSFHTGDCCCGPIYRNGSA